MWKYVSDAFVPSTESKWDDYEAEWATLATRDYNKYQVGQMWGREPYEDWYVARIEQDPGNVTTGFIRLAQPTVKWDLDKTKWEKCKTTNRQNYFVGKRAFTKSRDLKPWGGGWYVAQIDDTPDGPVLQLSPPKDLIPSRKLSMDERRASEAIGEVFCSSTLLSTLTACRVLPRMRRSGGRS